jgi:hypothetical protein
MLGLAGACSVEEIPSVGIRRSDAKTRDALDIVGFPPTEPHGDYESGCAGGGKCPIFE